MKRLIFFFLIVLPGVAWANSAAVRLYCASLRFHQATTRLFGQTYTLELSTGLSSEPANGELAPLFDPNAPSHASNFRLQDPSFPDPQTGAMAIDVPAALDEDGDGF